MKSRAKKTRRLVAILNLQYRISEWQLIQLRQREHELQGREAYLVEAFSDGKVLTGLSTEAIARQLNTTSVNARAIRLLVEDRLEQLRVEARRLRHMERTVKSVGGAERREAEKRLLDELTDALTGRLTGKTRFNHERSNIHVEPE